MYLYIYDSFLSHQKYDSFIHSLERKVTDLGIQGKVAKLTILKNIKELIVDGVRAGATTIVAVGDDQTFTKVINIVANLDVALGLIPVENGSTIGRALGLPPKELACDVIAARIIRKLDLGKINGYHFLMSAEVTNAHVALESDSYTISPTTELNSVRICNIGWHYDGRISNPTDGVLEAVITPIKSRLIGKKQLTPTIVPFTSIRLTSTDEDTQILVDNQVILKTPAAIEVAPQQLKIIVGSNRSFD